MACGVDRAAAAAFEGSSDGRRGVHARNEARATRRAGRPLAGGGPPGGFGYRGSLLHGRPGPGVDVGGHAAPDLRRRAARRVPRRAHPGAGLRAAPAPGIAPHHRERGGGGVRHGLCHLWRRHGGPAGARSRQHHQDPGGFGERLALGPRDRRAPPRFLEGGRPFRPGARSAGGRSRGARLGPAQELGLGPVERQQRPRPGDGGGARPRGCRRQPLGDRLPRAGLRRRPEGLSRRGAPLHSAEPAPSGREGARWGRRDPAPLAVRPDPDDDGDLPVHLGGVVLPRDRRRADPWAPGRAPRLRPHRRAAGRGPRDHAGRPGLRSQGPPRGHRHVPRRAMPGELRADPVHPEAGPRHSPGDDFRRTARPRRHLRPVGHRPGAAAPGGD